MSESGWATATRMLATHLVSIAAVVLASHRSLCVYLAVCSLSRPIFPERPDEPSVPLALSRFKTIVAKPWVRQTLKVLAGVLLVIVLWTVWIGAFVALLRFASQVVVDVVLTMLFGGFLWFNIVATLARFVDVPTTIKYKPKHPNATEKAEKSEFVLIKEFNRDLPVPWYQRVRNVYLSAALSTTVLLVAVSAGYTFPLVVIPATWILPMVAVFHAPHLSMRRVTQVLWGYLAMILTVIAIVVPICLHFANTKEDGKSPEQVDQDAKDRAEEALKWTEPSEWIGHVADMFHYLYIIGAPGVFIALTWRFDYVSQHTTYLGTRPTSEGQQESVMIPAMASIPTFWPQTATYAIGALVLCVIGLTGTFVINDAVGSALSSTGGLLVVIPVMTLSTAFGAWRHGVLREWWAYSETWIPEAGDVEAGNERSTEEPITKERVDEADPKTIHQTSSS